jgi:4-methyl-5(b-hydroxyethyl)-thiazole monophosphate biosynthesis
MANVCVFLADGFEEVEGLTVVDILRRAGQEVYMISVSGDLSVKGAHGIEVKADCAIDCVDFSAMDMLVLPGGMPGTKNLGNCSLLASQLKSFCEKGKWVGAICAAPSVLGDLGLLSGKKAVCYPGFEERLLGAEVTEERVVKDGNIVTSRGVGTAIPFALCLAGCLAGEEKAREIKESIIYGHNKD